MYKTARKIKGDAYATINGAWQVPQRSNSAWIFGSGHLLRLIIFWLCRACGMSKSDLSDGPQPPFRRIMNSERAFSPHTPSLSLSLRFRGAIVSPKPLGISSGRCQSLTWLVQLQVWFLPRLHSPCKCILFLEKVTSQFD